jgi:hypothetical protein
MSALQDFRQQNPEYDDLDDMTLANSLHQKSYSDMSKNEFYIKFLGAVPKQSPAKPKPEGTALDAVIEPIQAVGGGIINQIHAGYSGLANLPQGVDVAADAVRDQMNAPGLAPKTQKGERVLETIGDLMQTGIDIANFPISGIVGLAELMNGKGLDQAANTTRSIQDNGLAETLGERAMDETGSPGRATAAMMLPEVAASVSGLVGGRAALNAGKVPRSRLIDIRCRNISINS